MAKLTLTVDSRIAEHAKRYARARGTSVSRLVEGYLRLLGRANAEHDEPPVLRELRGILRGADPAAYRRHLVRKYR